MAGVMTGASASTWGAGSTVETGATSETGAIVVRLPGGAYKTVDVVSKAGARTVKGVTSDTDAKGTIVVHSGAGDVEVQGDR